MIGLIWDKLFAYGDKLHEENKKYERSIVHKCQDLVQEAWDESYKTAKMITDKEPEDEVERLVMSIPGIIVYFDINDETYFYELDGWHFNHPAEVIKYLISSRMDYKGYVQRKARLELLEYIRDEIKADKGNKKPLKYIYDKITDLKTELDKIAKPQNVIKCEIKKI